MAKGLLFIDYDNTMVVHNPNIYAYSSSDRDDFLKMMNSAEDIFKDDKPCKAMQWFVAKWKERGYKVICISYEKSNLRNHLKECRIQQFYGGDIPLVTTSSTEMKIDMMLSIIEHYGFKPDDCIFVDDNQGTVDLAVRAGITSYHTCNVEDWYLDAIHTYFKSLVQGIESGDVNNNVVNRLRTLIECPSESLA